MSQKSKIQSLRGEGNIEFLFCIKDGGVFALNGDLNIDSLTSSFLGASKFSSKFREGGVIFLSFSSLIIGIWYVSLSKDMVPAVELEMSLKAD